MSEPSEFLDKILKRASIDLSKSFIANEDIRERVEYVCRQISNRACVRLLMACMLELDRPEVDPRKPYFLHLFHRSRLDFLNAYQELVLNEPDSAVNQPLKEAFLALRQAAEADE